MSESIDQSNTSGAEPSGLPQQLASRIIDETIYLLYDATDYRPFDHTAERLGNGASYLAKTAMHITAETPSRISGAVSKTNQLAAGLGNIVANSLATVTQSPANHVVKDLDTSRTHTDDARQHLTVDHGRRRRATQRTASPRARRSAAEIIEVVAG